MLMCMYLLWRGLERAEDVLAGLEHAQGYIRHELAQRIELRVFPRMRFHWDPTFEKAEKIERLIASLHEETAPSGSKSEGQVNLDG